MGELAAEPLQGRVALVTGASRGVGAIVAQKLAERGADVVINFRSKAERAEAVAQAVRAAGRRACLALADLTAETAVAQMLDQVQAELGRIDLLILNASGGLERDKPATYAMEVNVHAQLRLVEKALPLLPPGARIIFVTSHMAHFYGQGATLPEYEPVAASKRACESLLRDRLAQFTAAGISLVVVSGDLIEGTITPKLLNRKRGGIIEKRRQQVGSLPTIEEFAEGIVTAAEKETAVNGETIFIGSTAAYPSE